jgi:hypothetical protein
MLASDAWNTNIVAVDRFDKCCHYKHLNIHMI